MDRVDNGPILSVIHMVATNTMLNNNGVDSGHRLKNLTCLESLTVRSLEVNRTVEIYN